MSGFFICSKLISEKEGVTPASVIVDIDTTIVFTNHLITDTPPADPYGMYYSTTNFIQILDYLYSQKDEIEVITLNEVYIERTFDRCQAFIRWDARPETRWFIFHNKDKRTVICSDSRCTI